ncbi:MAG: hypothetical protein WCI52_00955 [bacterium]
MEQPINALNNNQTPPKPVLPRVRTFKGDIADAVKKDNVSAVKIALAENKRRERNQQIEEIVSPTSKKNLVYIIATIVLLLGGLGVVSFFYFTNNNQPTNTPEITVKSDIIFSENKKDLVITGDSAPEIINDIAKEKSYQIPLGTVKKISFVSLIGTTSSPVSTQVLLNTFGSRAPDSLVRAFNPNLFFGLHSYDGNNPFLIINVDSFDQAYAGMLKWEPNIQDDIGGLFGVSGTKIASSTPEKKPTWQDRVINNKDTRALVGDDGNILLFYSFVNNNTLVFTSNQDTFKEVINRLTKPKLIH